MLYTFCLIFSCSSGIEIDEIKVPKSEEIERYQKKFGNITYDIFRSLYSSKIYKRDEIPEIHKYIKDCIDQILVKTIPNSNLIRSYLWEPVIFYSKDEDISSSGNCIYISISFLKSINLHEELIGILAHEIGHIVHGHIYQTCFNKNRILEIDALIDSYEKSINNEIRSKYVKDITKDIAPQTQEEFITSRNNEFEADDFAINALFNLGLSMKGFLDCFKKERDKMWKFKRYLAENVWAKYSTHPTDKDRIKNIIDNKRYDKNLSLLEPSEEFLLMKRKVNELSDSKKSYWFFADLQIQYN